jgi:hypothetical protein
MDLSEFDEVLLLDVIEHITNAEAFLDTLRKSVRDLRRRPRFVVTSGNVVFFIVRLQALFGNFNYGKQGILDHTHTRLYTFRSLRNLFEQCGFDVEQVSGIPAPFPKALGMNAFARTLVTVNSLLIRVSRGLFAYQIFLIARPRPTVDALLDHSIESSRERAAAVPETERNTVGSR